MPWTCSADDLSLGDEEGLEEEERENIYDNPRAYHGAPGEDEEDGGGEGEEDDGEQGEEDELEDEQQEEEGDPEERDQEEEDQGAEHG